MLTLSRTLLATTLLQLMLSLSASGQVQLSLSDSSSSLVELAPVTSKATDRTVASNKSEVPIEARLSDPASDDAHDEAKPNSEHASEAIYSSRVSHDPGTPRKPIWERPGDVNQAKSPPPRYCQDDRFRAGWPQTVREHARCSIDSHYSAWYVGGGSAFGLPHARPRTKEEGTWGLDYSLFKKPQLVWMRWTCGREQGGEGAYETDR